MTNGKKMGIGLLGWTLFLAVAEAQGPERRGPKPPTGMKSAMPALDVKALDDPKKAEAAAALLESAYQGQTPPEAVRMLIAILRGSRMGPGEGWFGPAQTRYTWEWLAHQCGVEPAKGSIPRKQYPYSDAWFAQLDRDKDGAITPSDLDWSDRNPYVQMSYLANRLFRKLNASGTGRLTKDELLQFFDQTASGKDHISSDDFRDSLLSGMFGGFLPGDAPTKSVLVRGLFASEIGSMNEGPKLNEAAPQFNLKTVDGKDAVDLAKLLGPKPVVLVFGNFTCGPFRSFYPDVERVYQRYKKDAHFLMIYVREAHPTNGWKMESNSRAGVAVKQPITFAERVSACNQFCTHLKSTMPVVIDEINDPVGNAYSGMPARLYILDRAGKIAYKSGRGPFGFRAGEMEQALVMLMMDPQPSSSAKTSERLPMLTNEQAWKRLPGAPATVQALPPWARLLAGSMPLTTARMLELDALHRSGERLEPKLRGLVRWAAADANRCAYAKAVAVADLRRDGATEAELRELIGDPSRLSSQQCAAVVFARKMMRQAYAVTDEEVKQLLQFFGEEQVVALVALVAHASFQDRLLLALNVQVGPEGPLPPLMVRFAKPQSKPSAEPKPPEQSPKFVRAATDGGGKGDWFALRESVESQKNRAGRIRVPSKEEVRKRLGDNHPGLWQSDIHWSRVCYGNQPELTEAWFDCVAAFRQESGLDRIFQQSLFWIVTQSLRCFY